MPDHQKPECCPSCRSGFTGSSLLDLCATCPCHKEAQPESLYSSTSEGPNFTPEQAEFINGLLARQKEELREKVENLPEKYSSIDGKKVVREEDILNLLS